MDVATISQLIGTLGFPIVCCGAMFWLVVRKDTQHAEEIATMKTAIDNNTIALIKLTDKIDNGGIENDSE